MTPKTTTATADASLTELLARVERGERVEIVRDGHPVAVLAPSRHASADSPGLQSKPSAGRPAYTEDQIARSRRAFESLSLLRKRILDEGRGLSAEEIKAGIEEGRL